MQNPVAELNRGWNRHSTKLYPVTTVTTFVVSFAIASNYLSQWEHALWIFAAIGLAAVGGIAGVKTMEHTA